MVPTPKPVQPGAGAPPSGTYDVPTPAPMPPPPPAPPEAVVYEDLATNEENQNELAGIGEAFQPAEPPEPEAPPPSDAEFDTQVRQMMADLLAGKGMDVNTAEEEALIRELMQDRLGAGLVEQRARMGRAGFGASGALAAMEGDVRRQAGQQATQETLALRRQAEQEAIDNALRAIGVDVEKRREGRQAAFDQEFLSALRSYLGQEDTGAPVAAPDATTAAASAMLDVANPAIFNQGVETEKPELASSGRGDEGMSSRNPIIVSSPPAGATLVNPNASFGGALYQGRDGKYYGVKA